MSDVVERAKAALSGVTEGPWDAPAQLLGSPCTTVFGVGRKHVLYHAGGYTDAQFVAAARSLVPELVTEVERLRGQEERLRALTDKWMADAGPDSKAHNVFGEQVVTVVFAVDSIRAALDEVVAP